jgi:hypothetical protein
MTTEYLREEQERIGFSVPKTKVSNSWKEKEERERERELGSRNRRGEHNSELADVPAAR